MAEIIAMHDASHHAYFAKGWVNKIAALSLDLIGGSSYFWHWKHVVFHHNKANIHRFDTDIDLGALGRFAPQSRHLVSAEHYRNLRASALSEWSRAVA